MNGHQAKILRGRAYGPVLTEYVGGAPPRYQPVEEGGVVTWVKISKGTPLRLAEGCARHAYNQRRTCSASNTPHPVSR